VTPHKRPSPAFIVASTAMLWLATGIAAVAFWPVHQSTQFIIMVAVTTVVASLVATIGSVYRLPGHVIVLAGLLVYVVLGVPLAVPDQALHGIIPTLGGLADLGLGTALSWKQLLTVTLPVGGYEALLVPSFIVVLVTVLVAQSIALRARVGEFAVLGPIVLLLAGILLGSTAEFFPLAVSLGLTVVLLAWMISFRWHRRRGARVSSARRRGNPTAGMLDHAGGLRAVVTAGLIVAVAAGGAVGATALLPPTGEREVLRSAIEKSFDPRNYPSPLSGFRQYLQTSNENATLLSIDGLPEGARIRVATLDSYDGIVYAVGGDEGGAGSGSFSLVPDRYDQSAVAGDHISLDITVGAYSGVWLPTVGKLEGVEFSASRDLRGSFYYNDNSGTAAVLKELGAGDRYRLTAVLPSVPDEEELESVTPGDAPLPPFEVVPDELSVALDRYVGGTGGDGARLQAAMSGLRENGYVSHGVSDEEPASRSGHSADRINELVSKPLMIGDGEQYAVAAALMARELGFPARVVFGFAPDAEPAGTTVVTGADVSAWVEVDTAQSGWVAIDPTPAVREIPDQQPEEPSRVARPQSPVTPPLDLPAVPDEQLPPDVTQDEDDAVDPLLTVLLAVLRIAGWAVLAAALVAAPFVAIIATKMWRRRLRRRSGSSLDRISGGWREFEDAVLDHGFDPPASWTRSEFAKTVGGPGPAGLAAGADRAVFAPTLPDASEADKVWRSVDELRRSLDTGLTRRQRIVARVSLRSLRRAVGSFSGSRGTG
jgi:hypothetical protein